VEIYNAYLEVINALVPEDFDELQDFYRWAFGKESVEEMISMSSMDGIKQWNRLHGDEYRLTAYGKVSTDIRIMIELWNDAVVCAL